MPETKLFLIETKITEFCSESLDNNELDNAKHFNI